MNPRRRRLSTGWRRLCVLTLLLASPALAQEPGYEILEHADVNVEHLQDVGVANRVVRLTRESRASVEERLGIRLPARPHVVVAPNDREFARRVQLVAGGPPGGHVLAMAFPGRDLIIIRESGLREGTDSGLERTFRHELAHLALGALERRRGKRLERWLNEGLAEWSAGRTPTGSEASALAGWAKFQTIPRLDTLAESFPGHGDASHRAYTVSMAFLCWIDEQEPGGCQNLVAALEQEKHTNAAFQRVMGRDVTMTELDWIVELSDDHEWWKSILYGLNVWSVTALLALLAIARHVVVTRRKKREMEEEEAAEDARRAHRRYGPHDLPQPWEGEPPPPAEDAPPPAEDLP